MNNRRSKQRIPLFLAGLFPIVSGMLWGGFWLNGIAGMEHFASGFALLALAFAAGTLFYRLRGIGVGKLAFWGVAFYLYVNFNLLFPAAFYFGMTGIDRKRDRYGIFFASGFLSGGLLGSCFGFPMLMLLLLSVAQFMVNTGVFHRKLPENKWQKLLAKFVNAAAFLGIICVCVLSFDRDYRDKQSASGASDITLLCALGLSERPKPEMLTVSRSTVMRMSAWKELISLHCDRISPVKRVDKKYDVIVVEDIPADAFNSPRRYIASLADGGILVLPVEMCRKIPELQWQTIPSSLDSGAVYAAARKHGKLNFSGDLIEKNILRIFTEIPAEQLLPGAISGALVGFEPKIPAVSAMLPHEELCYILYGAALLLILAEILCHKSALREYISTSQSAFAFALVAGILLSENSVSASVEYGWLLALLSGAVMFVQFSARPRALRGMLILAVAVSWSWYFFPGTAWAIAALLSSGMVLAFRQRHWLREHPGRKLDWQTILTALALAGGVFLGSSMPEAVKETLTVASIIYLWSLIRS